MFLCWSNSLMWILRLLIADVVFFFCPFFWSSLPFCGYKYSCIELNHLVFHQMHVGRIQLRLFCFWWCCASCLFPESFPSSICHPWDLMDMYPPSRMPFGAPTKNPPAARGSLGSGSAGVAGIRSPSGLQKWGGVEFGKPICGPKWRWNHVMSTQFLQAPIFSFLVRFAIFSIQKPWAVSFIQSPWKLLPIITEPPQRNKKRLGMFLLITWLPL